ncbi:MAG: GntR family transcriptional regulator [Phaeospirillum sp.]|nr:GntR family transcriptional regulator [Phaeospirillum sp.]
MPSLKRIGEGWCIVNGHALIDISLDQAKAFALQILVDCRMNAVDDRIETRTERLVRLILGDIADGTFAEGERLDESILARRYGVSRTPIREALIELAIFGAIIREPNKGCRVACRLLEIES